MKYAAIILLVFISSGVVHARQKLISLNCKSGGTNPNRRDRYSIPGEGNMVTILNYCAKLKDRNKTYEEFDRACLRHCLTSCKFPYGDCGEKDVDTLEHCTCYLDPKKDSPGFQAKLAAVNKTKSDLNKTEKPPTINEDRDQTLPKSDDYNLRGTTTNGIKKDAEVANKTANGTEESPQPGQKSEDGRSAADENLKEKRPSTNKVEGVKESSGDQENHDETSEQPRSTEDTVNEGASERESDKEAEGSDKNSSSDEREEGNVGQEGESSSSESQSEAVKDEEIDKDKKTDVRPGTNATQNKPGDGNVGQDEESSSSDSTSESLTKEDADHKPEAHKDQDENNGQEEESSSSESDSGSVTDHENGSNCSPSDTSESSESNSQPCDYDVLITDPTSNDESSSSGCSDITSSQQTEEDSLASEQKSSMNRCPFDSEESESGHPCEDYSQLSSMASSEVNLSDYPCLSDASDSTSSSSCGYSSEEPSSSEESSGSSSEETETEPPLPCTDLADIEEHNQELDYCMLEQLNATRREVPGMSSKTSELCEDYSDETSSESENISDLSLPCDDLSSTGERNEEIDVGSKCGGSSSQEPDTLEKHPSEDLYDYYDEFNSTETTNNTFHEEFGQYIPNGKPRNITDFEKIPIGSEENDNEIQEDYDEDSSHAPTEIPPNTFHKEHGKYIYDGKGKNSSSEFEEFSLEHEDGTQIDDHNEIMTPRPTPRHDNISNTIDNKNLHDITDSSSEELENKV